MAKIYQKIIAVFTGIFSYVVQVEYLNKKQTKIISKNYINDSGVDVSYCGTKSIILNEKNKIITIPTGLKIGLPKNIEAQIRSRSGIAANHGVFVINSPGTIDSGYTGEIKIILAKLTPGSFKIEPGDRIAQITFNKIPKIKIANITTKNTKLARNENGLGSSGLK